MTDDHKIMVTERTLPYSPQAVYSAFEDAAILAQWWGPDGFTNSFEAFHFTVGGAWVFDMIGPDGTRYANRNVFTDLVPAARLVIRHDCEPYFTLTVTLTPTQSPAQGGTQLSWHQAFDDAQFAQAVRHIVEPANEQNLDRLTRALQAGVR